MGVFRTKFVTENVEQCRETGEREGEAQNPTLHAKFSKKPSIDSREPQGSVSNFDERTENVEWGYFVQKKCRRAAAKTKSAISHLSLIHI